MDRKSMQELEQLIAAQLRGEQNDLAEVGRPEGTERRLDQRISKGSGTGGSPSTG